MPFPCEFEPELAVGTAMGKMIDLSRNDNEPILRLVSGRRFGVLGNSWRRDVAFDLVFAGTFLIQGRVVFLVLAATMTIVLHSIMLREERFLGKTYGEAFQQYCRDVGRYLSWRGKNGRRT